MEIIDSQKTDANADLPRRMPWSVRAASIIADSYCAIAAIAAIASAIYKKDLRILFFLFPFLLMFGACFDLHRGHRWSLRFFCLVGAICVACSIAAISFTDKWSVGVTVTISMVLPLIAVPVLLYLPSSRRWWRPEGRFKLRVLWLFFTAILILIFSDISQCAYYGYKANRRIRKCNEARGLSMLLVEDPNAREELARAKNSTDFVNRLIAADVAAGRKSDRLLMSALVDGVCQWCIAVDVSENVADGFPVVFSANIDPSDLPTEWDEEIGNKNIPCNVANAQDDNDWVFVAYKGVAAIYLKRKYLTARKFYNMPTGRIDRTVFYLTPDGRKALGGNLAK